MTRHQRLESAPHWTWGSISQNVLNEAVDQWKTSYVHAWRWKEGHHVEYLLK